MLLATKPKNYTEEFQKLTMLLKPDNDEIQPIAYSQIKNIDPMMLMIWMNQNGVYVLPTHELVHWLKDFIGDRSAIEICAGHNNLGRAVGITTTDSYMQVRNQEIRSYYTALGQKLTAPPADVVEMDGNAAVVAYQPEVVVGAFVTQKWEPMLQDGSVYGVDEEAIVVSGRVYIHIGNTYTHRNKQILRLPHKTYQPNWLVTRAQKPEQNCIWVWGE